MVLGLLVDWLPGCFGWLVVYGLLICLLWFLLLCRF